MPSLLRSTKSQQFYFFGIQASRRETFKDRIWGQQIHSTFIHPIYFCGRVATAFSAPITASVSVDIMTLLITQLPVTNVLHRLCCNSVCCRVGRPFKIGAPGIDEIEHDNDTTTILFPTFSYSYSHKTPTEKCLYLRYNFMTPSVSPSEFLATHL